MKDEFDDEEAKKILQKPGRYGKQVRIAPENVNPLLMTDEEENTPDPILITGKYPGTGKSRLALKWGNGRKDMLVVCPTNVLCDEISRSGYVAVTTHTLLGKRPLGVEDDQDFKPFDISSYNVILFQEIFFYPVYQLEWTYDFMISNRDKTFVANGDPAQNEPVGQTLNVDFDTYYNEITTWMFPRKLELTIPKRYLEKDRDKMTELYDELLEEKEHPFVIALKYLKVVDWNELKKDKNAAQYPHLAFTNNSTDRINDWAQKIKRGTDH